LFCLSAGEKDLGVNGKGSSAIVAEALLKPLREPAARELKFGARWFLHTSRPSFSWAVDHRKREIR
jgi:hypothetical protein